MSDLISRSALINALKIDRACIYSHVFSHVDCDAEEELMIDLVQIINNQPTIEATPVVHGRWLDMRESSKDVPQEMCSACGVSQYTVGIHEYKYCPHCGAKMKVGD